MSPQSQPFLAAGDGFHAELINSGDLYRIYVQLTLNGEGAGASLVWQRRHDDCQQGEAERAFELTASICRYLNACGGWNELRCIFEAFQTAFNAAEISLPAGWELWHCRYDVEDPTTVFVDPSQRVAMVHKHQIYSELMPLEALLEQIEVSEDQIPDTP